MSFLEPQMDELVHPNHPYRKLLSIINFSEFCKPLHSLYKDFGRPGYHIESGFMALVLQCFEDLSHNFDERKKLIFLILSLSFGKQVFLVYGNNLASFVYF